MIIGFSIGCIYKFFQALNRNDFITFFREKKYKINALEITIPKTHMKYFKLSKENYQYLKSLDYLSFHLTGDQVDNEVLGNVLFSLPEIDSYIVHIERYLENPDFYNNNFGNKLLIENIPDYTGNYPDNICFDVAHYMEELLSYKKKIYQSTIIKTMQKFKNIKEIHMSNYISDSKPHMPIHQSINILKYIQQIGRLSSIENIYSLPIIIESAFDNPFQIIKELKYIRGE